MILHTIFTRRFPHKPPIGCKQLPTASFLCIYLLIFLYDTRDDKEMVFIDFGIYFTSERQAMNMPMITAERAQAAVLFRDDSYK